MISTIETIFAKETVLLSTNQTGGGGCNGVTVGKGINHRSGILVTRIDGNEAV